MGVILKAYVRLSFLYSVQTGEATQIFVYSSKNQ